MVQKCCVPDCCNASYRKAPEITFHRFPKDEYLRNIWIKNVHRTNWQPNSSSVLCSKHFEPHLLCERDIRRILIPGAIPTLFETEELSVQDEENTSDPLAPSIQTASEVLVQYDVQILPSASIVSPHDSKDSPGTSAEKKLQDKVIKKNRKIKCLQEKNRRMKKKVKQFSDIIGELRKKLNEDSILSNTPVNNKDFMLRYIKSANLCVRKIISTGK